MAPAGGRDDLAVSRRLLAEGCRFDFFQAVRVLDRMARSTSRGEDRPASYPVGGDSAPAQESVRFRALAAHSFPAAAISEVRPPPTKPRPPAVVPPVAPSMPGQDAGGPGARPPVAALSAPPAAGAAEARPPVAALWGPPEMVTTFLGLTGPSGVLPLHYTALLIERVRAKDLALRDFLDLFHHRITSLFYRAWQKYRFPFAYEQSCWWSEEETADPLTQCLYCLLGLGTEGMRGRLAFDDEALLFYAGHFAHYPRCAQSLAAVLADYFELPVTLKQFHGQWLYLSPDSQSSLACPRWPEGLNTQLGGSVVIGQRVWDVEGKFRVRIGPLGYAAFRRLMPSGDVLRPLAQMIRSYAGPQFEFDVQVVLKAAEVPCCRLGGDGTDPARLGWNTWAYSAEVEHDAADAVFSWEG